MTDLEMTKLCAEAMGVEWRESPFSTENGWPYVPCPHATRDTSDEKGALKRYDPLHDDALAMALVKKLRINLTWTLDSTWLAEYWNSIYFDTENKDLNHAIVECVAKMQRTKSAQSSTEKADSA